jgi:predicted aspartyl protease
MRGSFNDADQPIIEIEVQGVNGISKKMEAMVDSGFNGFLQIPAIEAFSLGLVLIGMDDTAVASGESVLHLVCIGNVCVDNVCVTTDIIVLPTEVILIGTKLLKKLQKTFILDCEMGRVELVDYAA